MATAIAGPVLIMQALFCVLAGSFGLGILFILLSVLLQMVFPFESIGKSAEQSRRQSSLIRAIKVLAFVLFFMWLQQSPDVRATVNELIHSEAFLDWRFLAAASLWTCYVCLANWRIVQNLDDRLIYEFYTARRSPELQS